MGGRKVRNKHSAAGRFQSVLYVMEQLEMTDALESEQAVYQQDGIAS